MDATLENVKTAKLLSLGNYWEEWQKARVSSPLPGSLKHFRLVYSSLVGAFCADPQALLVPMDDHGFHRGDGVFEAFRIIHGKPYLLKEHLQRLERSSGAIGLPWPLSREQIEGLVHQGIAILRSQNGQAVHEDWIVRLYLTRGPGGFGVSPSESVGSSLYLVFSQFQEPSSEKLSQGVRVALSQVAVKPGLFARVKSLNYLPNVMMKMEANRQEVDFAIGIDPAGYVTEGPTENLMWIDADGQLCHPCMDRILDGCTMKRLLQLVKEAGMIPVRGETRAGFADLLRAKELLMVGTTLDVMPVCELQGHPVALGPGARELRNLIVKDQISS